MKRLTREDWKNPESMMWERVDELECSEMAKNAIKDVLKKLAEYEDLEEHRKLLKLPCAVGDTVYVVDKYIDIRGVPVWRKDFGELRYRIIESKFGLKDIGLMGKTVFLTYEEAEAALKEL